MRAEKIDPEEVGLGFGKTPRKRLISEVRREWSGPGSNRRHSDFQSDALPTELPDPTEVNKKSLENFLW